MRERAPRFQSPAPTSPTAVAEPPPVRAPAPVFQARKPVRHLAPEDTLTKESAAEYARVSPRTIGRWLAQGSLNRYLVQANRVRISRRELDQLLKARSIETHQA
jgi:excisionase family DNA binding protein